MTFERLNELEIIALQNICPCDRTGKGQLCDFALTMHDAVPKMVQTIKDLNGRCQYYENTRARAEVDLSLQQSIVIATLKNLVDALDNWDRVKPDDLAFMRKAKAMESIRDLIAKTLHPER